MIQGPLATLAPFLNAQTFWFLVKAAYLVALGLYVAFSLVIVSQVRQMTETIAGMMEWPLKLIAWVHFGVAVTAFFLGVVLL